MVTAVVMLSPVNFDSYSASRRASRFLIFRPIFYLYIENYESLYRGLIITQEEATRQGTFYDFVGYWAELSAALCSSETRRLVCKMPFSRSTMKTVSAHRAKRKFSELLS